MDNENYHRNHLCRVKGVLCIAEPSVVLGNLILQINCDQRRTGGAMVM